MFSKSNDPEEIGETGTVITGDSQETREVTGKPWLFRLSWGTKQTIRSMYPHG